MSSESERLASRNRSLDNVATVTSSPMASLPTTCMLCPMTGWFYLAPMGTD